MEKGEVIKFNLKALSRENLLQKLAKVDQSRWRNFNHFSKIQKN